MVEKCTLLQPAALPVKPHPSNKTDVHEQSTDIIYSKVWSYTNPIKPCDSFTHAQTVYTRPSPFFWKGPGYEATHDYTCTTVITRLHIYKLPLVPFTARDVYREQDSPGVGGCGCDCGSIEDGEL